MVVCMCVRRVVGGGRKFVLMLKGDKSSSSHNSYMISDKYI